MNISGDNIGFNQFKDPVDDIGDDIFTLKFSGRVALDYGKRATTINYYNGNGYYEINTSYGSYSGNDQANLLFNQADVIIPTGCELIAWDAQWVNEYVGQTDLRIDVLRLEFSGLTRTISIIPSAIGTITGMNNITVPYQISKTLSTPQPFNKGDGVIPVFSNITSQSFQGDLKGMNLVMKFKRV